MRLYLLLTLFFLAIGFPVAYTQPAFPQPVQKISKVKYDVSLRDTFFEKEYYSLQWFMLQNEDGSYSSALADSLGNPVIDTAKMVHTANCVSQQGYEHIIRYCDAWYKGDTLLLFLNDMTASTYDNLLVKVINGKFSCQYWTAYPSLQRSQKLTWTTTSQKLELDREKYKAGDKLKGKIYVMIKEEQLQHSGKKETCIILIEGAIKTNLISP
ncbi:MAG: hypothetical protein ACOZCO_14185 [Bacteroidota bacterium]